MSSQRARWRPDEEGDRGGEPAGRGVGVAAAQRRGLLLSGSGWISAGASRPRGRCAAGHVPPDLEQAGLLPERGVVQCGADRVLQLVQDGVDRRHLLGAPVFDQGREARRRALARLASIPASGWLSPGHSSVSRSRTCTGGSFSEAAASQDVQVFLGRADEPPGLDGAARHNDLLVQAGTFGAGDHDPDVSRDCRSAEQVAGNDAGRDPAEPALRPTAVAPDHSSARSSRRHIWTSR